MKRSDQALHLVHLYPGFLGQYGHQGNVLILSQRCRWRGVDCHIEEVAPGDSIPSQADLYVLAGGETAAIATVAQLLRQQAGLKQALNRGAVLFGIGSGFPLLGQTLWLRSGERIDGLGVLDLHSEPAGKRRVGPLVGKPLLPLDGPILGFEDHQRLIRLGKGLAPLARVRCGEGNGALQRTEGAWSGHVCGTSLRGPVLALNPALADWLLALLLGPLPPLSLLAVDRLRERFLHGLPQRCASRLRR